VRHKFHRTSRNNVELVARVPVRVDHVVLGEMLDLGQQPIAFSSISRSEVQKEKKSRWTTPLGKQDSCRDRPNPVNFRTNSRPFQAHGLPVILCREQLRLSF
jgi:hypothetical protein